MLKFIQIDKRKIHSLSTVRIYDIFLSKQQETIQNIKDNRYWEINSSSYFQMWNVHKVNELII